MRRNFGRIGAYIRRYSAKQFWPIYIERPGLITQATVFRFTVVVPADFNRNISSDRLILTALYIGPGQLHSELQQSCQPISTALYSVTASF